jgi:penicillin V acylase-like amidase (Ntn superfamily)
LIIMTILNLEKSFKGKLTVNESCSTFLLLKDNAPLFIGHNLDESTENVPGAIYINKRGENKRRISHQELILGKKGVDSKVNWTAKYGSVTFNIYGKDFPDGGMNEAGLYVQEMTLNGGKFATDSDLPCFFMTLWMQYILDSFTSVKEVVESLSSFTIDGWPWHFFVSDAEGNNTCIDFVDGTPTFYTEKNMPYPVMTNYFHDEELKVLSEYQGFGGKIPIDFTDMGDQDPMRPTRFVHACQLIKDAPENPDVTYAFKILYAMDRTSEYPTGGRHWSYIIDIKENKIYFETRKSSNRKLFNIRGFNFTNTEPAKIIDLHTKLEGDVTGNFQSITKEQNDQIISDGLGWLKKLADQTIGALKAMGANGEATLKDFGGEKMWSDEAFENFNHGLMTFSESILQLDYRWKILSTGKKFQM